MLSDLLRLVGLGGKSAEQFSVANDEQHDRVYEQGAHLVFPRMQVLGRRETASSKDRAQLMKGIACMAAVVKYNPHNWGAFWIAGKAYQSLGDHVQANQSFKAALDLERANADVAREYAVSCLELGMADEAVDAVRKSLKHNPRDAGLHSHLALALIIANKDEEARIAVSKALDVGSDDTMAEAVLEIIEDVESGKRPRPRNMEELDLV